MTACKRIIGVVMVENGLVVRRKGFKTQAIVGRPEVTVKYLQNWHIDELFIINVGPVCDIVNIVKAALDKCFIPVTVGGSISSLEEAKHYIRHGADKIVIGRYKSLDLCREISDFYGDQVMSISIDSDHEREYEKIKDWPIGEVIMHDSKRDGEGRGLNLDILGIETKQPKLAMGGIGSYEDIVEGLSICDGVCVGNLLHFKEISARLAKKEARERGILVR